MFAQVINNLDLAKEDRILLRNLLKEFYQTDLTLQENKTNFQHSRISHKRAYTLERSMAFKQEIMNIFIQAETKKKLNRFQYSQKDMKWLQVSLRKLIKTFKKQQYQQSVKVFKSNMHNRSLQRQRQQRVKNQRINHDNDNYQNERTYLGNSHLNLNLNLNNSRSLQNRPNFVQKSNKYSKEKVFNNKGLFIQNIPSQNKSYFSPKNINTSINSHRLNVNKFLEDQRHKHRHHHSNLSNSLQLQENRINKNSGTQVNYFNANLYRKSRIESTNNSKNANINNKSLNKLRQKQKIVKIKPTTNRSSNPHQNPNLKYLKQKNVSKVNGNNQPVFVKKKSSNQIQEIIYQSASKNSGSYAKNAYKYQGYQTGHFPELSEINFKQNSKNQKEQNNNFNINMDQNFRQTSIYKQNNDYKHKHRQPVIPQKDQSWLNHNKNMTFNSKSKNNQLNQKLKKYEQASKNLQKILQHKNQPFQQQQEKYKYKQKPKFAVLQTQSQLKRQRQHYSNVPMISSVNIHQNQINNNSQNLVSFDYQPQKTYQQQYPQRTYQQSYPQKTDQQSYEKLYEHFNGRQHEYITKKTYQQTYEKPYEHFNGRQHEYITKKTYQQTYEKPYEHFNGRQHEYFTQNRLEQQEQIFTKPQLLMECRKFINQSQMIKSKNSEISCEPTLTLTNNRSNIWIVEESGSEAKIFTPKQFQFQLQTNFSQKDKMKHNKHQNQQQNQHQQQHQHQCENTTTNNFNFDNKQKKLLNFSTKRLHITSPSKHTFTKIETAKQFLQKYFINQFKVQLTQKMANQMLENLCQSLKPVIQDLLQQSYTKSKNELNFEEVCNFFIRNGLLSEFKESISENIWNIINQANSRQITQHNIECFLQAIYQAGLVKIYNKAKYLLQKILKMASKISKSDQLEYVQHGNILKQLSATKYDIFFLQVNKIEELVQLKKLLDPYDFSYQ